MKRILCFASIVVICSKDVSFHYNLIYYWMRVCVFFWKEKRKPNVLTCDGFVTQISLVIFFLPGVCPYNRGGEGCQ